VDPKEEVRMKTLDRIVLLVFLAGLIGFAIYHLPSSLSAGQPSILDKLKWGMLLQTDRPFYSGGDTMKAVFGVYNFSAEHAYGWSPTPDGNGYGCAYAFTIENHLGEIVWEPYDVVCPAVIVYRDLPYGGRIRNSAQIPLIYDNDNGVGTIGDPLPPGFYKVNLSFKFNGPSRVQGDFPLGPGFSASVPIQIE
jgi:hypothetical protein